MRLKSSESGVVAACLEYLRLRGIFCWRQNQVAVHGRRFVGLKGVSDILGMVPEYWPDCEAVDAEFMACSGESALLAVECKTVSGRLSQDQKLFRKNVLDRGGLYVVARSIDDLKEAGL